MTQRCSQRTSHGMTLIEVMVALALLSLLSVGLITAFRLGGRTWHQITAVATSDRDVVTAQRFLRHILESTHPFRQPPGSRVTTFGLEGSARDLRVTAPMPQASGLGGNYRYELTEESGDRGLRRLRVRWWLDRNGSLIIPNTSVTGDPHEEILLDGVDSIAWSYLRATEHDNPSVPITERWQSSWTGNLKPPALVRLQVSFPSGDRRRWPELIVDPRVTDDSDCQFDVVSQACREN